MVSYVDIIGLCHSVTIYVVRYKCYVRWLRFYFKRTLITGLGQQTLIEPPDNNSLYILSSFILDHYFIVLICIGFVVIPQTLFDLNNCQLDFRMIEQKGMTQNHGFIHSLPLFSSLIKKGKKRRMNSDFMSFLSARSFRMDNKGYNPFCIFFYVFILIIIFLIFY